MFIGVCLKCTLNIYTKVKLINYCLIDGYFMFNCDMAVIVVNMIIYKLCVSWCILLSWLTGFRVISSLKNRGVKLKPVPASQLLMSIAGVQ